ncbi:MAG: helix-turn-helix transcriptional regulator [Henriciella sp.]
MARKDNRVFETADPGVHILQSKKAKFHNIISPVPAIIWVLNGTKRVCSEREQRDISSGCFVLLPENRSITVENIPQGDKPYEARVLAFGREIFESAYKRLSVREDLRRRVFQTVPDTDHVADAFVRARGALSDAKNLPEFIVNHRCEEVVLWLAEAGAYLPWKRTASFADRVRSVVAQRADHKWTSAEVGYELAVSEATLRRRLHAENTSFKKVLLELRMVVALTYLQTTNWPLSKVSAASGYSSQTRFAARFIERFGMHPAEIRSAAEVVSV